MFFIRIPSDLSDIKAILQPSRIDSRIPARKLTNDRKFRFFFSKSRAWILDFRYKLNLFIPYITSFDHISNILDLFQFVY